MTKAIFYLLKGTIGFRELKISPDLEVVGSPV